MIAASAEARTQMANSGIGKAAGTHSNKSDRNGSRMKKQSIFELKAQMARAERAYQDARERRIAAGGLDPVGSPPPPSLPQLTGEWKLQMEGKKTGV